MFDCNIAPMFESKNIQDVHPKCSSFHKMVEGYPLVNVNKKRTGTSPCYSWANQLFLCAMFKFAKCNLLVVWNMAFIFPYIGNIIIPTDSYFLEGQVNHQPGIAFIFCYIFTSLIYLWKMVIFHGKMLVYQAGYLRLLVYKLPEGQSHRCPSPTGWLINRGVSLPL